MNDYLIATSTKRSCQTDSLRRCYHICWGRCSARTSTQQLAQPQTDTSRHGQGLLFQNSTWTTTPLFGGGGFENTPSREVGRLQKHSLLTVLNIYYGRCVPTEVLNLPFGKLVPNKHLSSLEKTPLGSFFHFGWQYYPDTNIGRQKTEWYLKFILSQTLQCTIFAQPWENTGLSLLAKVNSKIKHSFWKTI